MSSRDRVSRRREWSKERDPPDMSLRASSKPDVNLVLCGSDAALKSSVSKCFVGEKTLSQSDSSTECVIYELERHGRVVSLVELPAVNHLSEEEVMRQTLRCVSLCDPGVHVFLIIVPVGPINNDNKAEIEKIQKIFYSREHFMALFISDLSVGDPVTDFVKHSTDSQRLISLCGGQYRVMGLKEPENSRQIPELLDYIEKMKTKPYSLQMYVKAQENRVRHETEEKYKEKLKRMENQIKELLQSVGAENQPDDQECLRIVLIGRTGSGKSATGNTILGRKEFESELSSDSVTTVCEKRVGEVDRRSVAVVDTPGLFYTTLTNQLAVEEIMKCVSMSSPGPHVFIIVVNLGKFTKEETDTVDLIKKIFGHKAAQFSIVLFTRGDELDDESIEDYVKRSKSEELQKLIRDCGNRFLVFNNREKQDKTQVIQLLNMIEEVKNTNEGQYFTNSMFEEAEMSIKKRMEEIMKEREREIETQREELQTKYEMDMKIMTKRLEEEKQRADEERKKMENQIREKEEKLRQEFEEKEKTEQKKREIENQKRLEEEKQRRAEYHQKIEEMKKKIDNQKRLEEEIQKRVQCCNKIEELKREIENQRLQYEKQLKEIKEEDRKREEKYRQDQEKMKHEQERIIAELQMKQEKEDRWRKEEEERWRLEIRNQQMREQEEEERKRKEKHEQLREKLEELEKMRKRFEREREEERWSIEEEREKQRREREEKERECEEKKTEMERYYAQVERERMQEWERRKREDDERREEERKRWVELIEDLKREQKEEMKRRETERKEREEKERDEMKKNTKRKY